MKIFAIGDLHLSKDERIEKPMYIFGEGWENHDAIVEDNWKRLVGEDDYVIICGDVSWGLRLDEAMADLEWISSLPGKKVITKGNHDLWWSSIKKLNSLFDNIYFLQNDAYFVDTEDGKTIAICGTRGWIARTYDGFDRHDEKIYTRELIRLEMSLEKGKNADFIVASLHYPPTGDNLQPTDVTNMLTTYGVKKCIYGHLHGKEAFKKGIKGVLSGVDYQLVSQDFIKGEPKLLYDNGKFVF